MVIALYEHGLILHTVDQMEEFEYELDELEAYWDSNLHELHAEPHSGIYGQEREHLAERMGHLREALRLAREHSAILGIS
jgi:hypothetical protein